jgi:sugar lactone lactonase YvrE
VTGGAAAPVPVTRPARLAESPVWDAASQTLLWVDILAGEVHRLDPATGRDTAVGVGVPVGAVAARRGGGLVIAAALGFATLDEASGTVEPGTVEPGTVDWLWAGALGDRMNDGKCDPAGRFLAGSLTYARDPGACALYRLDPGMPGDGGPRVSVLLDGVTLSNGLGWSPAGDLMYFADTPLERVDVMHYDPATGEASGRRPFADLHDVPGRPDGLTVDGEGAVWIAMSRGGAVRRYTPDGRLDRVIEFPVRLVTSVSFGGGDLGDLYVTTSRENLTESDLASQPLAGSVFVIPGTGVRGLPASSYAG